jgi:flagellar hook assembly protein FlgD
MNDIRYTLYVHLCVYDTHGHLVRTLVRAAQGPGYYTAVWDGRADDGRPVTSGVYLYRITAGGKTLMRKALLMK